MLLSCTLFLAPPSLLYFPIFFLPSSFNPGVSFQGRSGRPQVRHPGAVIFFLILFSHSFACSFLSFLFVVRPSLALAGACPKDGGDKMRRKRKGEEESEQVTPAGSSSPDFFFLPPLFSISTSQSWSGRTKGATWEQIGQGRACRCPLRPWWLCGLIVKGQFESRS